MGTTEAPTLKRGMNATVARAMLNAITTIRGRFTKCLLLQRRVCEMSAARCLLISEGCEGCAVEVGLTDVPMAQLRPLRVLDARVVEPQRGRNARAEVDHLGDIGGIGAPRSPSSVQLWRVAW